MHLSLHGDLVLGAGGRGQPPGGAALCGGVRNGQHRALEGAPVQARAAPLPRLSHRELLCSCRARHWHARSVHAKSHLHCK